jgi:hypothetical protein
MMTFVFAAVVLIGALCIAAALGGVECHNRPPQPRRKRPPHCPSETAESSAAAVWFVAPADQHWGGPCNTAAACRAPL